MWSSVHRLTSRLKINRFVVRDQLSGGCVGIMPNSMYGAESVPVRGVKPPNVVIYGGNTARVTRLLSDNLRPDRYVFLPLDAGQVNAGEPWQNHVELLVLAHCNDIPDAVSDAFRLYWTSGGKILCWRSPKFVNFCVGSRADVCTAAQITIVQHEATPSRTVTLTGTSTIVGLVTDTFIGRVLATDANQRLIFTGVYQTVGNGILAFSQLSKEDLLPDSVGSPDVDVMLDLWRRLLGDHLHLECGPAAAATRPTPCVVYAAHEDELSSFRHSLAALLDESQLLRGSKVTLRLAGDRDGGDPGPSGTPLSDDAVPLHCSAVHTVGQAPPPSNFRSDNYFRWLRTKVLGRLVVHADVMSSTMDTIDRPSFGRHGLVCIAERQTSGKGRGEHVWLSPPGGATFSVQLQFPLRSRLGERLPFVQHLCSLATAEGVRDLPGLQDLDIRLKWPNDIYFGDKVKLGGNIVRSTLTGDSVLCTAGIGINVANESPTACVNSLIKELFGDGVPSCTTEQVIASALSRLEELVDDVQRHGVEGACERYYQLWLHEQASVRLQRSDGVARPGTVIGLDEYGFLRVRLTECGSVVSVQPDGNSFDMLHNLVIVR